MNINLKSDITTIDLEKFTYSCEKIISQELLEDFAISPKVQLSPFVSFVTDDIIIRVRQDILGETLKTIKYPSNWKEAIKDRFAPDWIKDRWPVRYIIYELRAFYPKVSLPDQSHRLGFVRMS